MLFGVSKCTWDLGVATLGMFDTVAGNPVVVKLGTGLPEQNVSSRWSKDEPVSLQPRDGSVVEKSCENIYDLG